MTQEFERRLDAKLIVSIISAGVMSFLGVTVETAMNVTFPTLQNEFGVSIAQVQWVTTGYLLVLGLVVPVSAYLKRTVRMKTLLIAAITIFIAGSVLGGLAPAFWVLIAGRVLQAAGTGIALPLMFNIVLDQAPRTHLGVLMGLGALITALAPAVGPSVGGLIVNTFGWREIFWVTIPLLVLALLGALWAVRQATPLAPARFDVRGWILIAIGFSALILAINMMSTHGVLSWQVLGLMLVAVAALGIFAVYSWRDSAPIIDVRIFGSRTFVLTVGIVVIVQFITLGEGYLIPNHTQIVRGVDPFSAGVLLLPGCIIGAILAPISGRILDRFGAKWPLLFGTAMILLSAALYTVSFTGLSLMAIAAVYCIHTLGQGFTTGNSLTTGISSLDERLRADGNAAFNTLQQMGGALGTGVTTSIISAAGTGAAVPVFGMYAALAALGFASCIGIFSGRRARAAE